MKISAFIIISCFVFSLAEKSPALRRIKRTSSPTVRNETNTVLPDLKLMTDSDFGQTYRPSCKLENSAPEKPKGKEKRSVLGNIIAIKNKKIAALKNAAADQNDEKVVIASPDEISNIERTQTSENVKLNRIDFNNKMTSVPDSQSLPFVEPVKRKKNIITYIFGEPEMEGGNDQSPEVLPFPFAEMGEHEKDRSSSAERNMIYKFSNHDELRKNKNSTMQLTKSNYNNKGEITINNSTHNNTKSNNTSNNRNTNPIEIPYNKHKQIHPVFMSNFAYVTNDNGVKPSISGINHQKTSKGDTRKAHHNDSTLGQKSEFVSDLKNSKNYNKTDRVTNMSLVTQQRPLQSQVRIQLSESSPMTFPNVISSPLDSFLKIAHRLFSGLGHSDGAPFRSQGAQFFLNPISTVDLDDTDYLYNTLDGSQAVAGVRSAIAPLNAPPTLSLPLPLLPPLVLQSHYITGADHDDLQPLNFIEKAIETVLNGKHVGHVGVGGITASAINGLAGANESGDGEDDFELRCPLHHENIKRNDNQNHVIQVCSCHLYKKKKTA